jgi:hypothetical protein
LFPTDHSQILRQHATIRVATGMAMNTPVALVTAALTAAILLTATFLIATGTRGEGARPDDSAQMELMSPTSK